jgi:hypothetical protein
MIAHSYITKEQFDEFCDFIIDGQTTRQAAKSLGKNRRSIYKWINNHASQEQVHQYARALQMSADSLAEDGLEIVDDDSLDIGFDDEGKPFVKGENIQRSKERASYRKWLAGKREPKKYGESTTLKGDKDNPLTPAIIKLDLGSPDAGAD